MEWHRVIPILSRVEEMKALFSFLLMSAPFYNRYFEDGMCR